MTTLPLPCRETRAVSRDSAWNTAPIFGCRRPWDLPLTVLGADRSEECRASARCWSSESAMTSQPGILRFVAGIGEESCR